MLVSPIWCKETRENTINVAAPPRPPFRGPEPSFSLHSPGKSDGLYKDETEGRCLICCPESRLKYS